MSLYGNKIKIGGVTCGLVMRGGSNGRYLAVFEREFASLEQIEAIKWDPPTVEGETILPAGYGFEVKQIEYAMGTRSYTVHLQVAEQYLGDVAGYQSQVTELQQTVTGLEGTVAEKEAALQEKDAALQEKTAELEAKETALQEKQTTIDQQATEMQEQEQTISELDSTVQSQEQTIAELEAAGSAADLKAEMEIAYEEGVESNG